MAKDIPLDQQLAELRREHADRIRTYPALTIGPKKAFSREEGQKRMARLEAAINTIENLKVQQERLRSEGAPTPLFPSPDPKF